MLAIYSVMDIRAAASPVAYEDAVAAMEDRVAAIRAGTADELLWLLEHPPLYTAGTSARDSDLLDARFPVHRTGRGGQYTYHGPGQRVGYIMLDLKNRQQVPDIKNYIYSLEEWIIRSLAAFGIAGERREGRVGIWVARGGGREDKIAAIGVRVRHWVTYHGVAINVDPDLSHFSGIVPCGISAHGVTSMRDLLEREVTMSELDQVLAEKFSEIFECRRAAA
jgi:lipoyl(octanoyl) transferase